MTINGLTVAEYAARLGVTRQRVHQLILEAGIRPRTILGHRILTPSDVKAIENRPKKLMGRPVSKSA